MRTLFIETTMGASGDMLLGSLIGLMDDPQGFVKRLEQIGIDGLEVECKKSDSMGVAGNRLIVRIDGVEEGGHHDHKHKHKHKDHDHHHRGDEEDQHERHHHKKDKKDHDKKDKKRKERSDDDKNIELKLEKEATDHKCCGHFHLHEDGHKSCCRESTEHHTSDSEHRRKDDHEDRSHEHHPHRDIASLGKMIDRLAIPAHIKTQAKEIYQLLAEAEAIAHNKPSSQIHFHELGEKDAVFDIVGVCLAMDEIGAEKIIATPVHVGYGKVKTAHGKLPIPAPATAELLKGIPIYSKDIKGELCTPTGAALLKYFVRGFRQMPPATWDRIGYGIGSKEFKEPNILRTFLGECDL